MEKIIVRIQYVEINNLQNVEHGSIKMACNTKDKLSDSSSDILGIYGQNGSGKTTFINALGILDALLSGKRLSSDTVNYITKGETQSQLRFDFSITEDKNSYRVIYEVTISKRDKDEWEENSDDFNSIVVSKEKLRYSQYLKGEWSSLRSLIEYDINDKKIFKPITNLQEISGGKTDVISELLVAKKIAIKQSTSFVFSTDTQKQIMNHCTNSVYKDIISSLYNYGRNNLFVISNHNTGLITMNFALPFRYRIDKNGVPTMGIVWLRLDEPTVILVTVLKLINQVIRVMNTVLCEIIPGLQVDIEDRGKQLMQDGAEGVRVELVSVRNDRKISLKYESEGINKIISILHMLIEMYNNPSTTLAIDELDAGIYEYLLGEILKVINETGKGQLIFTSHNLRPLETLNKNSIMFTTTNPSNRYMRLANVKTNNNLRDVYYHDLILGGQKECIYEPTNTFAISRSFRIAGEVNAE